MPIYAYKCASCGHAKDVLQKISDAPLSVCPACGAATFNKQVTAAGFQLKGSGWYATDFRGSGAAPAANADKAEAAKPAEAAKSDSAAKTDSAAKPADTGSTPPPKTGTPSASAGSCGAGCGCH
jgi:putative FmdB family regulatory protein